MAKDDAHEFMPCPECDGEGELDYGFDIRRRSLMDTCDRCHGQRRVEKP